MGHVEAFELTDGGQSAEEVAERVAAFLRPAKRSLELALYDIRLPGEVGDRVADELRAAAARGVRIRLVYNVDTGAPAGDPPAAERPGRSSLHELPIEDRGVPGIPDLMHHKYVVRDGEAVLDRLDQLDHRLVDAPGERDRRARLARPSRPPTPPTSRSCGSAATSSARGASSRPRSTSGGGCTVRAWFTPGHGTDALAGDRERDRARAAAGADRLAGDHLGAGARDARRARRPRRRRRRRA